MAEGADRDPEDDIIPGRMYGRYVCSKGTEDEHSFKSWNPKEESRDCRIHPGRKAIRDEYRPLKKSDIPDDYRLFGKFICDCGKEWGSANAWKNYFQRCKKQDCAYKECTCAGINRKTCTREECRKEVYTWDFNLLHGNGGKNNKNGHLINDCEKCQELRRKGIADDCLDYKGRGRAASRPNSRPNSRPGSGFGRRE